jgi:hypothetical protein
MSTTAFSQWSTTASSNTDLNGITLDGAVMTAGQVDDAIRELMAQLAAGVVGYSATAVATITSTDAGASAGPALELYRNSASPATSDILGVVRFTGKDSAGNVQTYAEIYPVISDATSGSEDAILAFRTVIAGTVSNFIYLGSNYGGGVAPNAIGLPFGQLSFPPTQNASSDANTLDDYEEGTFTPAFSATGATFSYFSQTGTYVKVGQHVYFTAAIVLNGSGNTLTANALSLTGLPFTAVTSNAQALATVLWANSTSSYTQLLAFVNSNASTMSFMGATAAATSLSAQNANQVLHATNVTSITVTGVYRAAA